jgi:hypothetical protein
MSDDIWQERYDILYGHIHDMYNEEVDTIVGCISHKKTAQKMAMDRVLNCIINTQRSMESMLDNYNSRIEILRLLKIMGMGGIELEEVDCTEIKSIGQIEPVIRIMVNNYMTINKLRQDYDNEEREMLMNGNLQCKRTLDWLMKELHITQEDIDIEI